MGGSDNKGDGLASQLCRYRVPGQPLLNQHQVGGVSRSRDGLFAQKEREPIGGRPAVRGKGTYGGQPGQRIEEQGTWASRTQKHNEAGYGRPVDRGVWTAKTVKRPRQQPAHPQYANYWAPLTCKQHTSHIQHSPNTPTIGLREHGNETSKSTGRSGQQKATRRNIRREERVTVQGPVKEQQPDGMSHRGGYFRNCGWIGVQPSPLPPWVYAAQMVESRKVLVDKYRQAGWEIIYTDGSSKDHPTLGRVGGYWLYFGDTRDTATHIPREEWQTNNRGELRAALHAVQHKNKSKRTLICSNSLLVVQGIMGKAQKWCRHDWQGSAGPVGHVDLWTHLLHETESQGTAIQWLHVPSHKGVDGNTHADRLTDIGRRRSPLLKGQVTVSLAGGESLDESESEPESDLEAPAIWTGMEGVGDHGTPLPPR